MLQSLFTGAHFSLTNSTRGCWVGRVARCPDHEIRVELVAAWTAPVVIYGRKNLCVQVDVGPRCSSVRARWLLYFPRPPRECAPLCSGQAEADNWTGSAMTEVRQRAPYQQIHCR